ncbi:hypothetical protein [Sulfurimonas sp. HSL-1716]|uniref:hypothetical protein n=1 Tax=Hydrocurvibacter sulfurireducens TaxID=3131937 RepID=UPI0031F930F9
MEYMLDTNIFNIILDEEKINISDFKNNITCYATHIQYDEINKTKSEKRRNELNQIFSLVRDAMLPTETFVLDKSRYDAARLSDGVLYQEIKNYMNTLNKKKKKNEEDALIAETAIKNNLVLVTSDPELRQAMKKFNGKVAEFTDIYPNEI